MKNKKIIYLAVSLLLITLIITSLLLIKEKNNIEELTYTKFTELVQKGKVKSITLGNNSKISGELKNQKNFITDNPRTEDFKENLLLKGIKVNEGETNTIIDIIRFVLIIGGVFTLIFFLNKNKSKLAQKEMNEMSNIDINNDSDSNLTFDDVAGNEEAKDSLKELVDFIKNPEKYEKYGARMPRGVLLYGPPGTGKTLLAKALAGESEVPYFAVTGSDFIQIYAGVGASRIRSLFKKAKEHGKCVIFIDEIDALGKKRRGGMGNSNDESDRTLNALLTEMSGFNGNHGIIVIAATNRIDTLDDALLRPGRFDRQIEVGLPDVNARFKILKLHSKNKPMDKEIDYNRLAHETVYFSGAKLEGLMNESAMIAAKNNESYITMKHIDKAYYTVIAGEEKRDRSSITLDERKVTAYHEAGHALVTKLFSPQNRVTKVTIIPSTKGIGGFSMNVPPDRMYQTKEDIKNNILISLGGRAAEEIIFGEERITTGASNDIKKATDMVLSMISTLGMDKESGLINYEIMLGNNFGSNQYLLKRAKDILNELYSEVKETLLERKDLLEKITFELLDKETLNEEELNNLIN